MLRSSHKVITSLRNISAQKALLPKGALAYINGEHVESVSKTSFEVRNPYSNEIVAFTASCEVDDAERAVAAARSALQNWSLETTPKQRGAILQKWYNLMVEKESALAELLTLEQGKPLAEARGEIQYSAAFLDWYSGEARRIYGQVVTPSVLNREHIHIREPIGVVVLITPWNFPTAMIARKAGAALAAGCTLVVKPAEETPLSALAFAQLGEEAGIPAGVFNVIPSVHANTQVISKYLCSTTDVDAISFTGSTAVGKLLLSQSASTVKRVCLELGGNAPLIVFESADLATAVKGTMATKFRASGQTCVSANRIFVHERIHDSYVNKLVEAMKGLKVGDGMVPETNQGPLINDKAVAKIQSLLSDAVSKGAKVVLGGKRGKGSCFQPTLLTEVTDEMEIAHTEIFGPIASLRKFTDEDVVLKQANLKEMVPRRLRELIESTDWDNGEKPLGPTGEFLQFPIEETGAYDDLCEIYNSFSSFFLVSSVKTAGKLLQLFEDCNVDFPVHVVSDWSSPRDDSCFFGLTSNYSVVTSFLRDFDILAEGEEESASPRNEPVNDEVSRYLQGNEGSRVYSGDHCYLFSSKRQPLTKKKVIDLMSVKAQVLYSQSDLLNATCPLLPPELTGVGSFVYLVDHNSMDPREPFIDKMGSHSGKVDGTRTSNNYENTGYTLIEDQFVPFNGSGEPSHILKSFQYTPPHCKRISKKVFAMIDASGRVSHPVVGVFSYKSEGPRFPGALPHGNSRGDVPYTRLRPSDRDCAEKLLATMSVKKAWSRMKQRGQGISITNMRSIAKSLNRPGARGRRPVSNLMSIINSAITNRKGVRIEQVTHLIKGDDGSKDRVGTATMMFFEEPAAVYVKSCPKLEKVKDFRSSIDDLATTEEKQAFLKRACKNSDVSGSFVEFGGGLFYDSSFDLGDFFVSPLYGEISGFRNALSEKKSYVVVGCLLHNSKCKDVHESFFGFISRRLVRLGKDVICPLIISDDERSFDMIREYPFFKHAMHLNCDMHMLVNLERRFGKARRLKLQSILFGASLRCMTTHRTTLRPGLLHAWSKEGFENAVKAEATKGSVTQEESNWFLANSKRLVSRHGMLTRLKAGLALQFVTSNVIEGLNKRMKDSMGKFRRTCSQLQNDIADYSREEMVEIRDAVEVGTGPVRLLKKLPTPFSDCSPEEQSSILHRHGLKREVVAAPNFVPALAEFYFEGRSDQKRKELIAAVLDCAVDFTPTCAYVKSRINKGVAVPVTFDSTNHRIACESPDCLKNRHPMCLHKVAVLRQFSLEIRQKYDEVLEEDSENNPTACLMVGGSKGSRKLSQKSVNNNSRKLDEIILRSKLSDNTRGGGGTVKTALTCSTNLSYDRTGNCGNDDLDRSSSDDHDISLESGSAEISSSELLADITLSPVAQRRRSGRSVSVARRFSPGPSPHKVARHQSQV